MTTFKIALIAAAATVTLAGPSFAQNFQGFGAPSYVTNAQPSQTQKPVALKTHKHVKHEQTR